MNRLCRSAVVMACMFAAWPAIRADAVETGDSAKAAHRQSPHHGHAHETTSDGESGAALPATDPGLWPHLLLGGYCLLVVGASLLGGWLPSLMRLTHSRMQTLISFVGGLMLGIGLLHLLPHGAHELGSLDAAISWMLAGIVAMFLLMRVSHAHQHEPIELAAEPHDHDHDRDHDRDRELPHGSEPGLLAHRFSWLGLAVALCLHTLIDGIALGAHVSADAGHEVAFSLLGFGTFLGVLLHKPLDAIPITSLMAAGGWSAKARNLVNLGFSLICPLGALLFVLGVAQFHGTVQEQVIGCALAFSAGVFLCISLGDLLPEMEFHSHDRLRLSVALLLGIALAWGITFLEPEHLHGG